MTSPADFRKGPHTHARGHAAEDEAVVWLTEQGYEVVARNVATSAGEIDLVARDGETLCFIEIKARAGALYGPAVASVTRRKQARLGRAASLYLARHPHDGPCRFDVVGLDVRDDRWERTLVKDAFHLR